MQKVVQPKKRKQSKITDHLIASCASPTTTTTTTTTTTMDSMMKARKSMIGAMAKYMILSNQGTHINMSV